MDVPDLELPPLKKLSRRRKWLIFGGLFFVFGVIGWLWLRDDALEDDSDLMLSLPKVPEEENGLRFFDGLENDWDLYGSDFMEGIWMGEWNSQSAETQVKFYPEVLDALKNAAGEKHLRSRDSARFLKDERIALLAPTGKLAYANALLAFEDERYQEALAQVGILLKAARLIMDGCHQSEELFAGVDFYRSASKILQEFLKIEQAAWNEEPEEIILQMAGDSRKLETAFKRAYCGFHCRTKERILDDSMSLDPTPSSRTPVYYRRAFLKPNRTLNSFARELRIIVDRSEQPFNVIEPDVIYSQPSAVGWWVGGNLTGEMLFHDAFSPGGLYHKSTKVYSSTGLAIVAVKTVQSRMEILRILAGLRAYFRKNSELPEDLSLLVPEFIEEVPADRFDGKPLRYSREQAKVWCVGWDLIDDGGIETEETKFSLMPDPMMRLKWLAVSTLDQDGAETGQRATIRQKP